MSFIFPVLACSCSADEKPKTFKQNGRGAVKTAHQPSRKNCWVTEVPCGAFAQLVDSNFPHFIKGRQTGTCFGDWLFNSQIHFDSFSAHCHQTVRTYSFILAPRGAVVFVHCHSQYTAPAADKFGSLVRTMLLKWCVYFIYLLFKFYIISLSLSHSQNHST